MWRGGVDQIGNHSLEMDCTVSNSLFRPLKVGEVDLPHRMVMAPLTRNRADTNGCATDLIVEYYSQRATAALIISESTPISPQGVGYPFTPWIYSEEHASAWGRVTRAVLAAGGRMFAQLQHCGRISHPSLQLLGELPVAPSAIRPDGQAVTYLGMQDFPTPRALESDEVPSIVAQFSRGARMALRAGFTGVEVHGANGYIIDQFLRDGSNHRTDKYGGSVHNRMRLLNEILDAVSEVWPAGRIGVRLTPENSYNSMSDSDPQGHFEYIVGQLSGRGLAYIHVLEGDMLSAARKVNYRALRARFNGTYLANNGYTFETASAAVQEGAADLIAFGVPFLANPDLVRRFQEGLPLNQADRATFYSGGKAGYTDYPFSS